MTIGKVVAFCRRVDPEAWDGLMAAMPAGWQVSLVNPDDERAVAEQLVDAEYVIAMDGSPLSSKVFEPAKKLRIIQARGQGTEHLPVKWAVERGIFVANAGGANAIAVAEGTVLLMLACMRRLILLTESMRNGKFGAGMDRKGSRELYDKTVGVVGFGNIGRRVATLCFGFGANIVYYERMFVSYALRADLKARPVSLDELLSISDVVTLHVPGLASNVGLIGAEQLARMKPTAYLINTSRGSIIDQDALVRTLQEKRIAGAGLDVWDPEPPDPQNPLLHMDNVVATPHQIGRAWETGGRAYDAIWRNVLLVSEGKDPMDRVREV